MGKFILGTFSLNINKMWLRKVSPKIWKWVTPTIKHKKSSTVNLLSLSQETQDLSYNCSQVLIQWHIPSFHSLSDELEVTFLCLM